MNDAQRIRAQVLRALALNRTPGLHFAGHFNEIFFERLDARHARLTVAAGAHNVDRDGQVNLGVALMAADMAIAGSIRAGLDPATRLATVSLALQFTGARLEGPLVASGEFAGFFGEGGARQGLGRVQVTGGAGPVCHGHGAFIALEAPAGVAMHPVPERPREVPALAEGDLTRAECDLLAHADAVLAGGTQDFLDRLWGLAARRTATGATGRMKNGAHVANRVHHVQGGLMMAFAAASAAAALPHRWALTGITSCFVSPGQGESLQARSKVVHHGLMTGVVRTELLGPDRRRVLETTTTHSRLAAPA